MLNYYMKLEDELHMTSFSSPEQRTWLNLLVTSKRVDELFRSVFSKAGLTEQQYNVLRILRGRHPCPLSLGEVQKRMVDKSSNATRLVEKLRQKGLVERCVCRKNRRKVDIRIIEGGLELLSQMDPEMECLIEQVFRNLDEMEIRQLDELLEKFRG